MGREHAQPRKSLFEVLCIRHLLNLDRQGGYLESGIILLHRVTKRLCSKRFRDPIADGPSLSPYSYILLH